MNVKAIINLKVEKKSKVNKNCTFIELIYISFNLRPKKIVWVLYSDCGLYKNVHAKPR
jgi:hypothetical protein